MNYTEVQQIKIKNMEGRYNFRLLRLQNLKLNGILKFNFYKKSALLLTMLDTIQHVKSWVKYGRYDYWNREQ